MVGLVLCLADRADHGEGSMALFADILSSGNWITGLAIGRPFATAAEMNGIVETNKPFLSLAA